MIYTRTGDSGRTCLDVCMSKTHPCIHFLGALDEAMSFVGLAIEQVDKEDVRQGLIRAYNILEKIAGAAYTGWCPSDELIREIEREIDSAPKPSGFISNYSLEKRVAPVAVARTVIRRAERWFWSCNENFKYCKNIGKLLNRLSDYVFILQYKATL